MQAVGLVVLGIAVGVAASFRRIFAVILAALAVCLFVKR